MEQVIFPRNKYYSQTEVVRLYNVSAKAYKQLLFDHQIDIVTRNINLGEFSVNTIYVLKEDVLKLGLQLRKCSVNH